MSCYCCFFDPQRDYKEKKLSDICPICGRRYDYVLKNAPQKIIDKNNNRTYEVLKSISRGFYGVTYLCEIKKRFRIEKVLLKVIPKRVYDFFGKDFEQECRKHDEVARETEHLVKINDAFLSNICYGKENLECHVAELEYVDGSLLEDFINDDNNCQPKIFAQIVIDLLKMRNEFELKGEYHNDLHAKNIMVEWLGDNIQRVDAVFDKIRLVAIDMNSVADESLSNSNGERIGDRTYIARHIRVLGEKLREHYKSVDRMSDMEFRLTEEFFHLSQFFSVPAYSVNAPEINEMIKGVCDVFKNNMSFSPWKQKLSLSRISDGINAQTISTSHIPQLLVDPDNKWIEKVSGQSPLLITGMRGCGKTMLLGALDIHARLGNVEEDKKRNSFDEHVLSQDSYISVYASCRELIDLTNVEKFALPKLIILYAVQIIRAGRHLWDMSSSLVNKNYHRGISDCVEKIFGIKIEEEYLYSSISLEKYLCDISNHIIEFGDVHQLKIPIIAVFETLSDVYLNISPVLSDKKVFFLLDDASTRYLPVETISALLSQILFMSSKCAFKITTEMQTLYGVKSPGKIEKAQDSRDYDIFDLGADVFNSTRESEKGKIFIENILIKRLEVYGLMRNVPRKLNEVLGDCTLKSIANFVVNHTKSGDRKKVYHGATALAALCVGDIGDIILLYDSIIDQNRNNKFPVDIEIQHKCFQQLCSRRIYNLERRNGTLREYAKAFAEASYRSLMDSGKCNNEGRIHIRQYNSLYIRISKGDLEAQKKKIRELVDAGIFVYSDGNGWPRAKSTDYDPSLQVKLAFRKIFGLSNFIGLSNADRYELSAEAAEEWLRNPTKEGLLKKTVTSEESEILKDDYEEKDIIDLSELDNADKAEELLDNMLDENKQYSLFDMELFGNTGDAQTGMYITTQKRTEEYINRINLVKKRKIFTNKSYDLGIFGLGFEERTLESIKRIITNNVFKELILIRYQEKGFSDEIEKNIPQRVKYKIFDMNQFKEINDEISKAESVLVDITGLYKPIIYYVVRNVIKGRSKIDVVYTAAKEYYPLNSDIEKEYPIEDWDEATKFTKLMQRLTIGENGDYYNKGLMDEYDYDPTRPVALIGFVSPKNQRLFSILDRMEYNYISLLLPNGNTGRDKLSRLAGSIAYANYPMVDRVEFDINRPREVLLKIAENYCKNYFEREANVEIALTSSKIQAVLVATFSSIVKFSQCWYVQPKEFDVEHFTRGVGDTTCYEIQIKN